MKDGLTCFDFSRMFSETPADIVLCNKALPLSTNVGVRECCVVSHKATEKSNMLRETGENISEQEPEGS